ncbi:gramicidin dehydrogenase [Brevibacillus panacihumi W25]|uniref:Gramicidin dehydrogenase n=1 Tax=Brevibacillus panacihumi W25 TaxID=1408254 RepID=V6MB65_9BACL|nr:alpha/beta fold hydrolase [Brevibacillus panacihumi]EST55784.1 gramicidin dehydrogenase [Brevibacillus panacihumi W25]
MKMFCLPYAGASANVYSPWSKHLSPEIEVIPVELAGRGRRFLEPLYPTLDHAVEDLLPFMQEQLADGEPYVLFGHSMGALLAYELTIRIEEVALPKPICSIFSGKNAPGTAMDKLRHQLSDDDLLSELMLLGGTPEELARDREMRQLFLPVIRNDFRLVEEYRHKIKRNKVTCPIAILTGLHDSLTTSAYIREWTHVSGHSCKFYSFPGGHFFIHEQTAEVLGVIQEIVLSSLYPYHAR